MATGRVESSYETETTEMSQTYRYVGWCVRVWGGGSVDEEKVATLVLWCFRSESGLDAKRRDFS